MFDICEQTPEFALTEAMSAAIREELGVAIEEQTGFREPSEAGQVNRAFRVMCRRHYPADRTVGRGPAGVPEPDSQPACTTAT